MAAGQAKQERNAAIFMSLASVFIAGMEWLDRPEPGEFVEAEPDWYVTFTVLLHGAILLLLVLALVRLGKITADTPAQRVPLLGLILAGLVGAAYVVGRDLGLV